MESFDWSRWLEGHGAPDPLERTLYEPQPDSPRSCPDCGGPVAVGVRAEGILDLRCPTHGSRYAVPPLGLEPGGYHRNPCRGDLPGDARGLAVLVERALVAAYGLAADFEVAVYACDTTACERLLGRLSGPRSL